MDLEGNMAVFEPIAVFQLINLAQQTGELVLDAGDNSARVYFDNGSIAFAEISNRRIKLGEFLVSQKLIKKKDLDKSLEKKRKNERLGKILVEDGVIGEDTLRSAIEEQIKEVVYEVVRWKKGKFSFSSGKKAVKQDIFIDIPLDHLMLEGLKRLDEEGDPQE